MPSRSRRHDSLTFPFRTTTNSTVPIGGARRSELRQYGLLFVGILLVVLYELLSTFNVGKIGQPSDIGGGLILLVGYVLTGIAVLRIAWELGRNRRSRRKDGR